MAHYTHIEHTDAATIDFLLSIGAVQVPDCSETHSVWVLGLRIYIPLREPIHNLMDLLQVVNNQSYNYGVQSGKQIAVTQINQHFSNLVFNRQ